MGRHEWVDIRDEIPDAVIDLRYAGPRNLFGRAVYPVNRAFLRAPVADRLARAAETLRGQGYRLVVWDAYRPLSAQRLMWEAFPDEDFVAPPTRGSRHNRGAAVDVTLADADGNVLEMPSDFDDFSPRSWNDATDAAPEPIARRGTLRGAMLDAGFLGIREEWWHFSDPDWHEWPLCDEGLEGPSE